MAFFLQISSLELGGPVHGLRLLPLPGPSMTDVRVFHRRLARARKRFNKRKETDDRAFGDMSLHKSTINHIINTMKFVKNVDDQGHLNVKKTWRTQALIAAVAASVDRDAWVTVNIFPWPIRCLLAQFLASCMRNWVWKKSVRGGSPNFCHWSRRRRGSGSEESHCRLSP